MSGPHNKPIQRMPAEAETIKERLPAAPYIAIASVVDVLPPKKACKNP